MSSEKNKIIMNPVIEAINNRMSIRSYKPKPIPKDIINTIIEAGNQAPSRGREEKETKKFLFQPWRFVVVVDPEFRQKLVQTTLPFWKKMTESMKETHPEVYKQVMMQYEAMDEPKDMVYYSAPVILFVIGLAGYDVSCALACENIMVAATSFGLGSCYVGFGAMVKGNADVVQALELKDDERIYGPILLGYPKEEPSALASIRPKKKEPTIKWI
jgi:nitroreductase